MKRTLLLPLFVLGASLSQATVLISQNFDGLNNGDLAGQAGFTDFSGEGGFQVGPSGTGKGVFVNTDPLGANAYAFPDLNYAPTAAEPILTSSVTIRGAGFAAGAGGTTGSRFGLQVYSNGGNSLIGALDIRFVAGGTAAQYRYSVDGGTATAVDRTFNQNQDYTLGIRLDTAANRVTFLLDNAVLFTGAYTSSDASISDVDLFASPLGYDTAVFDNYRIEATPASAVPEPATLAALGLGVAAFLRRRRNK